MLQTVQITVDMQSVPVSPSVFVHGCRKGDVLRKMQVVGSNATLKVEEKVINICGWLIVLGITRMTSDGNPGGGNPPCFLVPKYQ